MASRKESSTPSKLQCSWPTGETISINGMSPEHRQKVQEIGLAAWMEEYASKTQPPSPATKSERLTRTMCDCAVCAKRFPAQRPDAKYCSSKCRKRGSRRGFSFRGQTVTINAFCAP